MKNREEFEKSVYQKCAAHKRRLHRNIALCSALSVAVCVSVSAMFVCMKTYENGLHDSYADADMDSPSLTLSASFGGNTTSGVINNDCAPTVNENERYESTASSTMCDSIVVEECNSCLPAEEAFVEMTLRIYSGTDGDFDEYIISDEALTEIVAMMDEIGDLSHDSVFDKVVVKIHDRESVAAYYVEKNQLSQLTELLSRFDCKKNN